MTGLGANVVMNDIYVEEFYVSSNAQVVNHAKTTKTSFIGVHWVPLPSCSLLHNATYVYNLKFKYCNKWYCDDVDDTHYNGQYNTTLSRH